MIRFIALITALFVTAFPALAQIKIEPVTSPGGIKAWLVNEPSIPIISFDFIFKGGASLDAADKQGATYLMTGLLEEGTGDMDAADYSRATESLAARFGFDATRDMVNLSATVLKSNAPEALALFGKAINAPAFNQVAVDRVKGQVISGLKSDETDPSAIASKSLREQMFPNHPYARGIEGTIDTVTALSADDLRAAHQGVMARDRLFIGVVGDVTAAELGPMLDALLGDLPATGAPMPKRTDFAATGGITVIEHNSPQSQALWAQKGIERTSDDFFAMYVMNRVLGAGGFTSRLTQEVREKRGLTYGVYSYLAPSDFGDFIGGSVASSNDKIAEAIALITSEWQRIVDGGVTDAELDAAKTYLTGAYPLRFDGNSQIAGILSGMQYQDLGLNYIPTRNDRVNAVTREDVARVAKQYLDPDGLRFVVVGKPEGLDALK